MLYAAWVYAAVARTYCKTIKVYGFCLKSSFLSINDRFFDLWLWVSRTTELKIAGLVKLFT